MSETSYHYIELPHTGRNTTGKYRVVRDDQVRAWEDGQRHAYPVYGLFDKLGPAAEHVRTMDANLKATAQRKQSADG